MRSSTLSSCHDEYAAGAGDGFDRGGRHEQAGAGDGCCRSAVANSPGFSRPSAFGATASTVSARWSVCNAGDTNRTFAANVFARIGVDGQPDRLPALTRERYCSGTVSSTRSGSILTTVATFVPRVT